MLNLRLNLVMVDKNSGPQCFLKRFIVATLPKIKSHSANIRINYYIFIEYIIRLMKLQTVVLHHTAKAMKVMNEAIV